MTTTPDPSDFRALCAELADSVELLLEMRGSARPMQITEDRLKRARAALATPPPEPPGPPTDEELNRLCDYEFTTSTGHGERVDVLGFARAVLERWGRPATPPPAPPTDEELLRKYGKAKRDHCYEGDLDDWPKKAERAATVAGLRAVLERWGR